MKWVGLALGVVLLLPAVAFFALLFFSNASVAVIEPGGSVMLIAFALSALLGALLILVSLRALLRARQTPRS